MALVYAAFSLIISDVAATAKRRGQHRIGREWCSRSRRAIAYRACNAVGGGCSGAGSLIAAVIVRVVLRRASRLACGQLALNPL